MAGAAGAAVRAVLPGRQVAAAATVAAPAPVHLCDYVGYLHALNRIQIALIRTEETQDHEKELAQWEQHLGRFGTRTAALRIAVNAFSAQARQNLSLQHQQRSSLKPITESIRANQEALKSDVEKEFEAHIAWERAEVNLAYDAIDTEIKSGNVAIH